MEVVWSTAAQSLRGLAADYARQRREEWGAESRRTRTLDAAERGYRRFVDGLQRYDITERTKQDIAAIVRNLVQPGDPPIKVVIRPNPLSVDASHVVFPDQPAEIWLPLGLLAFARNANELAGLLAYQIAGIRQGYERALAQRLVTTRFRQSRNLTSDLRSEIEKLNRDQAAGRPVDPAHRTNVEEALTLSLRMDQYEDRATIQTQTLRQMRLALDVSDVTRRRILAAKEAVDRMIRAGYDPWGALLPRKRHARVTDYRESFDEHLRRLFGRPANTGETINSELEFIRNYLLFLETKKVDLQRQPFKDQELPLRLSLLHYLATGSQVAMMRGVARYYAGGLITTLGSWLAVDAMFSGKDKAPAAAATESETKPKEQESGFWKGLFIGSYGLLIGVPLVTATESAIRGFFFDLKKGYGEFGARYRDHVRQGTAFAEELKGLEKTGQRLPPEAVQRLLQRYRESSLFLVDGTDPSLQRIGARGLYMDLHEAPFLSTYRFFHRIDRRALFANAGVRALMEEYEERAREAISSHGIDPKSRTGRHAVKSEARRQMRQDMVFSDFDFRSRHIDAYGLDESSKEELKAYRWQRRLYGLTGMISRTMVARNTDRVLSYLERYLSSPDLTPDQKREILEPLIGTAAAQHLEPEQQRRYLELVGRHHPDGALLDKPLEEVVRERARIPEELFQTILSYRSSLPMSSADAHTLLRELVRNNRYRLAGRFVLKNMEFLSRDQSADTFSLLSEVIQKTPRDAGNPIEKRLLVNALTVRAFSLLNRHQLTALWSHLGSDLRNPVSKGLMNLPMSLLVRWNYMNREDMGSLLDRLDVLHAHGADRNLISDLLLKQIQSRRLSLDEISGIIEREHVWKSFSRVGEGATGSEMERQLVRKYELLARRYSAFTYDPLRSEQIQRVLLREFLRNKPNPTPEERIELWEQLARRGATGLTDGLFQEAFDGLRDPKRRHDLAETAFNEHLVWNKALLARVFREVNANTYHEGYLRESGNRLSQELLDRVRDFSPSGSQEQRVGETQELLRLMGRNLHFPDEAGRRYARDLRTAISRLATEGGDPTARRAAGTFRPALDRQPIAQRDPAVERQRLLRMLEENPAALQRYAEYRVVENETGKLVGHFADGGPALVDLMDWVSKEMRLGQEHTMHVKEKMIQVEQRKGDDLAYSILNTLVEQAVNWTKEERWQTVRWLRGSGPPPRSLTRMFRTMGVESVRRLYSTLPVTWRMVFMSTLVDSAKNSLLRGRQKALFYEQILNELLPEQKQSAEIARELLSAFLHSVEAAGNPEKKMAVLSYLLANHSEGPANTGRVLRNVLEAYGVVGVKFGQLLAASDVLPEDIRSELAQLRDGANPPRLFEIYEQLHDILRTTRIEPHFRIKRLLGSASVKYAVLVEDAQGREHVIQIKREEAGVSLNKDLKQLEIMVDYLVSRNRRRYAFLRGLAGATRDAIIRELSLVRESERTRTAQEQYRSLEYPEHVRPNVPGETELVASLPGPRGKVHFMRSSVFVEGTTIDRFPPEARKELARIVLDTEYQIYYGDERERRFIDPDRHPGNILLQRMGIHIEFQPIDWGQLLELTTADREVVEKVMAYSQILEVVGPLDSVISRLQRDFGLSESSARAMAREIGTYFPNQARSSRSALGGYYFLMSVLEKHGLPKKLIYYDFIKGIYQLEAYEELLRGEEHRSPKERFAADVEARAQEVGVDLGAGRIELIRYALRNPRSALAARRNYQAYQQGRMELRDVVELLGLSNGARDALVERYSRDRIRTGEEFVLWLGQSVHEAGSRFSDQDRRRIERWLARPELERADLAALQLKDFVRVGTTPTIQRAIREEANTRRARIQAPPVPVNPIIGTSEMYAAELISAVFWGLWDRDQSLARHWLQEVMTLKKHVGFAAFAAASHLWNNVVTRAIPMSLAKARYLSAEGGSMAIGMMASDLVHRMLSGQRYDDALGAVLSRENLANVGFSTVAFVIASNVVDRASRQLNRAPMAASALCQRWFSRLGRTALMFIAAEGIQRASRPALERAGILDEPELDRFQRLSLEYTDRIRTQLALLERDLAAPDGCVLLQHFYGIRKGNPSVIRMDEARRESLLGDPLDGFSSGSFDPHALEPNLMTSIHEYFFFLELARDQAKDPVVQGWIEEERRSTSGLLNQFVDRFVIVPLAESIEKRGRSPVDEFQDLLNRCVGPYQVPEAPRGGSNE